ncbi:Na+/H+ antiporter NhaC family protein [Desulforamulus aeronauticus]|uniref:Transporter, NhaC family n=1 Tax=Desulforamulus aeronauticus DSM 10349 TaxID=1121421 RepID=A0A1M6VW71_9FIRM|nr:Na+/H+ antiporter NhaC family protein [Desulforamulus aeronauticus]SHK85628.1 transporter, NhaC family [Desulforamulus aeronauticus DSM 10349]
MTKQVIEHDTNNSHKLEMYGGIWGALLPLVLLISLLIWLSVEDRGGTKPFWAAGWLAIVFGLFLAKSKKNYSESIMRGIGDKNGIVIVTAWLLAGVFGKLMVAGGLVNGLFWFGIETGTQGALFALVAFVSAMLFSLGTGSSTGTTISLVPVLYPAGVFLGADPAILAAAILAGAAFGDNLAPVSDTTIVSAYTQGATMQEVVKSRFPLAMTAAIIAAVVILITGGGGEVKPLLEIQDKLDAGGLLMLISFAVVVVSALSGRHIVESLIYGNVSAMLLGMINGNINLQQIFSIPVEKGGSTGIIEDGIQGVVGAIIFALLILAITQVLIESGVMNKMLNWATKTVAKTVRQAELAIIGITILISTPISANAPAELLVGPSLVKPLGEKFNLAPARRANLMDCAVCTLFFMLPWHICVVAWYGALVSAAQANNIVAPSISAAFLNPYSWALLVVIIFSAVTGWNRKYANEVK